MACVCLQHPDIVLPSQKIQYSQWSLSAEGYGEAAEIEGEWEVNEEEGGESKRTASTVFDSRSQIAPVPEVVPLPTAKKRMRKSALPFLILQSVPSGTISSHVNYTRG